MTFLRPCKFYPKSAFEKLQKYFKFRLKHKKICENITVDSVAAVFEDDLVKYMPLRDKDGRRILYVHAGSKPDILWVLFVKSKYMVLVEKWNASKISTHDIFRAMQLSLHAAMAEPMTQVIGFNSS